MRSKLLVDNCGDRCHRSLVVHRQHRTGHCCPGNNRVGSRATIGGQQELAVQPVHTCLAHIFDTHIRDALFLEVQQVGGLRRQIDNASMRKRAAIIDPNHDGALVVQVGNTHITWQRQSRMGSREVVLVVDLAVGCQPTMEIGSIPGRLAGCGIGRVLFGLVPFATDLVGLADLVAAATLLHLFGFGDARASGYTILGRRELYFVVDFGELGVL